MRISSSSARLISAFIFGFALIIPLMNRGGVITVYEAIAFIWLLFLIPAFFLHTSIKRASEGKGQLKVTLAIYVLASSVYSALEPVMAGYDLGYFAFIIPLLISFLLLLPSLWVRHRFYYAKPKQQITADSRYTESLRNAVKGIDDDPPEVAIADTPMRNGRSYVTYTDGVNKKILIHSEALELFDEKELNAAVLKKYFEIRKKDALKFIYASNLAVVAFVDGLIILAILSTIMNSQTYLSYILLAAMLVLVALIITMPYLIRILVRRKEASSDLECVRLSGNAEYLKSYITKSLANYKPSPLMTARRIDRVRKVLGKQDLYRLNKIDSAGSRH